MPWPGAGTQVSTGIARRDPVAEPQPAHAGGGEHQGIVVAAVEFPQPRVHVAADRREAAPAESAAASWAIRRTLPVPMTGASSEMRRARRQVADARSRRAARARRAGPRAAAPPRPREPSGSSDGMSFALWTARSTSPRRSASSISLTNRRFVPVSVSGRSWRRSPAVLMMTSSTRVPRASSSPATVRACHNARAAAPGADLQRPSSTAWRLSVRFSVAFSSAARLNSRFSASA